MPILQGKDNTETWMKVIVEWLTFVIRLYVKEWRLSGTNRRPVNSRKFKHNLTIGKQRRQNWVAIIIYLCVVINGSIKISDKLSSKYRIMQYFVSLQVKKPMYRIATTACRQSSNAPHKYNTIILLYTNKPFFYFKTYHVKRSFSADWVFKWHSNTVYRQGRSKAVQITRNWLT